MAHLKVCSEKKSSRKKIDVTDVTILVTVKKGSEVTPVTLDPALDLAMNPLSARSQWPSAVTTWKDLAFVFFCVNFQCDPGDR